MTCRPCSEGRHAQCEPVTDPDREMTFVDCACLHDPVCVDRDAQITALLVEAHLAFQRGDDQATVITLERALIVLQPWRAEKVRGRTAAEDRLPADKKPIRKLALVGYAQASGEPLPDWMTRTHGDKR